MIERLQSQPGVISVGDHQRRAARRRRARDDAVRHRRPRHRRSRAAADHATSASPARSTSRRIGIPLVSGRVFNDLDTEESLRVVVINKSMAKYWDGTDPVGSRISADRGETLVHRRRRRRRRPAVRPRAGNRRAALHSADADAAGLCRPGAGAHRRRSDGVRQRAAQHRARRRSESAGRGRADARRSAIGSAGRAAADGDAAGDVRRHWRCS